MKRIKRTLAAVLIVMILATSVLCLTVSAAGSTLGFSRKSVTVGGKVSVTVTLNAGTAMYATEATVNYDAALLQFDGGESANGGGGSVAIIGMPAGATKQSYVLNFTALAAGSCKVSVGNAQYVGNSDSATALSGSAATLTITPPVSTAANLSALSLSTGTLSPAFSAGRTSYTATVEYATESVTVSAKGAQGAKITGTGEKKLEVGDNKITVSVTGTDGTQKTYTITVKRLAEGEKLAPDGTIIPTALSVLLDGKDGQIMTTLPETAPDGFEAATVEYNGEQIPVYQSANKEYQLFSIKRLEDELLEYYVYDAVRDEFRVLEYITLGGKMFIFAKAQGEYKVPEGFMESTTNLGNGTPTVYFYAEPSMSEFYVFYAYCGGRFGYYRYDTLEQTVQRAPDFKLIYPGDEAAQKDGIFSRLLALTTQAKIIIVAMVVLVAGIIALIVLLAIRRTKINEFEEEELTADPDFNFDYIEEAAQQLTGISEEVYEKED